MEAKRKDDKEEMSEEVDSLRISFLEQFIDTHSKDPIHQFHCPHCGLELNPRKFQFDDESTVWGIFDNCRPFKEHKVYPTLKEAIEAFKWQK